MTQSAGQSRRMIGTTGIKARCTDCMWSRDCFALLCDEDTSMVAHSCSSMSSREQSSSTARRRLDFRQKRNAPVEGTSINKGHAGTLSRSNSASFIGSTDILNNNTIKQCVDFFAATDLGDESKSEQASQEEAHIQDVRYVVAQGIPQKDQAQYEALVRDTLSRRTEQILKADEWMFQKENERIHDSFNG